MDKRFGCGVASAFPPSLMSSVSVIAENVRRATLSGVFRYELCRGTQPENGLWIMRHAIWLNGNDFGSGYGCVHGWFRFHANFNWMKCFDRRCPNALCLLPNWSWMKISCENMTNLRECMQIWVWETPLLLVSIYSLSQVHRTRSMCAHLHCFWHRMFPGTV